MRSPSKGKMNSACTIQWLKKTLKERPTTRHEKTQHGCGCWNFKTLRFPLAMELSKLTLLGKEQCHYDFVRCHNILNFIVTKEYLQIYTLWFQLEVSRSTSLPFSVDHNERKSLHPQLLKQSSWKLFYNINPQTCLLAFYQQIPRWSLQQSAFSVI